MKKKILMAAVGFLAASCVPRDWTLLDDGESLSSLTQITESERPCINPYGGANGNNLYFSMYEKGGYLNIYSKPIATSSNVVKKTSGKNINLFPCYNQATNSVVFACKNEGMYRADIFSMSANADKGLHQITDSSDGNESNPCYSKDGRYVVFDKHPGAFYSLDQILCKWPSYSQALNSEMWMKDLRTGEMTLLGKGYQPQFSPDGKKIAFVRYSSDIESCNLWIMSLDSREVMKITDARKGYAFYPRWSPDGKKIVFQLTKKDKKDADLWVVDTDGNNMVQLTINKSYDGSPYWATDGSLYFVSDRGQVRGNYQIWRIKMDGFNKETYNDSSVKTGSGLKRVSR